MVAVAVAGWLRQYRIWSAIWRELNGQKSLGEPAPTQSEPNTLFLTHTSRHYSIPLFLRIILVLGFFDPGKKMASNGGRGLRKPVFVKVESLKPGTNGHTMAVKVVNSTTVLQKGAAASPHLRNTRIAECLVGDDTASILFTARNDQGILLFYVLPRYLYA